MATYRATVRLDGVEGEDAVEARRLIEDRLKDSALGKWTVVSVERQRPGGVVPSRGRVAPGESVWRRQSNTGGVLLAAAALWAFWFFWQLSGYIE